MRPVDAACARCRYCGEAGIHYQSYSTLGSQWQYQAGQQDKGNPVHRSAVITAIAESKGWSNVQVRGAMHDSPMHDSPLLPAGP